ncbi:MAG: hypothetical protein PWP08_335 [Methanofollis sp.]|nr:hypothetical protein [Methanofollis sp.]
MFWCSVWAGFALLILGIPAVSATTIGAVLGDDVPLSGTSTGGGDVYLFLTGPNLASGGVGLDRLSPVVTGSTSSFTVVSADKDNKWHYRWNTAGLSLDPGVYTLYASDTPAAKGDLDARNAVYGTVGISLHSPGLTLDTGGTLVIRASVDDAQVVINGEDVGKTPLNLSGVGSGEYTVSVNASGYERWSGTAMVKNNEKTEIDAVLIPLATTEETPPSTIPTTTPTAAPLLPGAFCALVLLALRKR